MQKNTSERLALFDALPGEAGGWLAQRDNETIMRERLGMTPDAIQSANDYAAQAGRDSLVWVCAQVGVSKLSALPNWTG